MLIHLITLATILSLPGTLPICEYNDGPPESAGGGVADFEGGGQRGSRGSQIPSACGAYSAKPLSPEF